MLKIVGMLATMGTSAKRDGAFRGLVGFAEGQREEDVKEALREFNEGRPVRGDRGHDEEGPSEPEVAIERARS